MKLSTLAFATIAVFGTALVAPFTGAFGFQDIPESHQEPPEREEVRTPEAGERQQGRRGRRGGQGLPSRMLAEAQEMITEGQCQEAIPVLACFATRDRGYEVAQLGLAQCLTQTARTLEDSAQKITQHGQALFWADRAASFGDANAQAFLAYHYAAGEIATPNGREAAKWLALFKRNPRTVNLGFGQLLPGTEKLVGSITDDDDLSHAAAEASAWLQLYEAAPPPPEMIPAGSCPRLTRRDRENEDFEDEHPERVMKRRRPPR